MSAGRNADDVSTCRVSSTSVATAGSSVSRTASPSLYSSSARTPVVLPGPSSTVASTVRVSLRYDLLQYPGFFPTSGADPLEPGNMITTKRGRRGLWIESSVTTREHED